MTYVNPKIFPLAVGKSYTNAAGLLITLVRSKPVTSGREFDHCFLDETGQRYLPNGRALKANKPRLIAVNQRHLREPAQVMIVGRNYKHHWRTGGTGFFTVLSLREDGKGYRIRWSNDAEIDVQYGCSLNYDSVLIIP